MVLLKGVVALSLLIGRDRVYILDGSLPIFSTDYLIIINKIQVNNDMKQKGTVVHFSCLNVLYFVDGFRFIQ